MNPRIRETGVYAKKGEVSVCEDGHRLAVFTKDVMLGDDAQESDFAFENGAFRGMWACPICKGITMTQNCEYFFEGGE